jgi:hypothetical protein
MQRFLLLQLLCAANAAIGGIALCDLTSLKAASQAWVCQGSPAALQAQQANLIVANLAGVNTSQPVCWTPSELEGAITYIICNLLNTIEGGGENPA